MIIVQSCYAKQFKIEDQKPFCMLNCWKDLQGCDKLGDVKVEGGECLC